MKNMLDYSSEMVSAITRFSNLPLDSFKRFKHLYMVHDGPKYKFPHPVRYGTKCIGMQHPLVKRLVTYAIVRYGSAENVAHFWNVTMKKRMITDFIILFERIDVAKMLPREIFGDKIKTHVWPLKCKVYFPTKTNRPIRVWDITMKYNGSESFHVASIRNGWMSLDDDDDQNGWGEPLREIDEPENYMEPDDELGERFIRMLDS